MPPGDLSSGRVDAVHARRQMALDAHYKAYPGRYVSGPPKAKRPPAVMAINPGDGLETAEAFLNAPPPSIEAVAPVAIPERDNVQ